MRSVSGTGTRPLRRDARLNRERILRVADEAFSRHGLDVPVDQIARGAGVGMGTLYRHFPTKTALIDAIFEQHLNELADVARDALGDPDAWAGLRRFLEAAIGAQAESRGFAEIVAVHLRDERLVARARESVRPLLAALIANAQAAGALRSDVVYEDVAALLWTSGRIVASTRDVAPEFWRRYLALTLDGLRAANATPLPAPPLSAAQQLAAMRQAAERLSADTL
jgi:AcrR family transcriptional regulator